MLIEINKSILERFVKDKEFMYQLVNSWVSETNEHYSWYGLGLHYGHKHLSIRLRGTTQFSIKYYNYDADYITDLREIEKRIVKFKKL